MDVTSAILQVVQDSCQCAYGQSEVDGELFRCFDGSEDSVTYRARLLATAEVGTQSLVSSLEQWVAAGSSVVVGGVALTVDAGCSVEISDRLQKEAECGAEQTDETDHTAAVAGAVVGGVLAVLIVAAIITTIVIIIVIVMRR